MIKIGNIREKNRSSEGYRSKAGHSGRACKALYTGSIPVAASSQSPANRRAGCAKRRRTEAGSAAAAKRRSIRGGQRGEASGYRRQHGSSWSSERNTLASATPPLTCSGVRRVRRPPSPTPEAFRPGPQTRAVARRNTSCPCNDGLRVVTGAADLRRDLMPAVGAALWQCSGRP